MITVEQIRAARALLDWSQADLAARSGLSQTGVARIENGTNKPNSKTLAKIQTAFDAADIEFIDTTGVKKRRGEGKVYRGHKGVSFFLDDVYETAIQNGTKESPVEIFLSNVVNENRVKWMGPDKWKNHTDRMTKDQDIMDVRIIVKHGDTNFPASDYSQYKWFPEELFNAQSFYSYHNKLAFLNFQDDDVFITIMKQADFAEGYRNMFRVIWNNVAQDPQ